jgi:hypothetical protein
MATGDITRFLRGFSLSIIFSGCVSSSVLTTESSEQRADFSTRCRAPGVVRCFGFDSQTEVEPYIYPGFDAKIRPEIDKDVKASGTGSLRFTVPPNSPADSSGSFQFNFSDDLSVQFGQGQEFFVQWRQRFSTEFLDTFYEGGLGWKQIVIGEGDRPGFFSPGCTQLEIVVSNTEQRGYPQMYHSCGGKDGQYETLAMERYMPYAANEWMTFQIHVKIGTWYQNDFNYKGDSTIQFWVAREGKPPKSVVHLSPQTATFFGLEIPWTGNGYDLANTNPEAQYGKILLTPYHTGKSESQDHPTGYVWYDELIVSTQRIAEPL